MMHVIKIGPMQQSIHSALPITHCLIGRRDASFGKPPDALFKKVWRVNAPKAERPTPDELVQVRAYGFKVDQNVYDTQALAWATSEAEAESLKAQFPAPEWDQTSFQILPSKSFQNG